MISGIFRLVIVFAIVITLGRCKPIHRGHEPRTRRVYELVRHLAYQLEECNSRHQLCDLAYLVTVRQWEKNFTLREKIIVFDGFEIEIANPQPNFCVIAIPKSDDESLSLWFDYRGRRRWESSQDRKRVVAECIESTDVYRK
jgi:hypothetical protein